jgi:hypothetical protein
MTKTDLDMIDMADVESLSANAGDSLFLSSCLTWERSRLKGHPWIE